VLLLVLARRVKLFNKSNVGWGNDITLTYQVLVAFYNLRKENG
jgi:hypothetical protein